MDNSISQLASTSLEQDIYDESNIVANSEITLNRMDVQDGEENEEDYENDEDESEEEQEKIGKKSREKYGKKTALHRAAERLIMAALREDVDTLARKFCLNDNDLSLTRFARLFKSMDFSTIFLGRFTNADLVEVFILFFKIFKWVFYSYYFSSFQKIFFTTLLAICLMLHLHNKCRHI
jgi:hypothetical protein